MTARQVPVCLTVAGSDSGGGAGIQADLHTFAALGCHGTSAITALTAQSPDGVFGVHPVPEEMVALQIDVVLRDLEPAAVKTGMLGTAGLVAAVAGRLEDAGVERLVVDPVMVATSGARLLDAGAEASLAERLLPLALLATPNLPELEALAGASLADEDARIEAGRRLLERGPRWLVVKGGHLDGPAVDLLLGPGGRIDRLESPRYPVDTHGSGCTFASAIAARLAHGDSVPDAVAAAKTYVSRALERAVLLGGRGPFLSHLG